MSLYGEYIKEREDREIIENDFGFITYRAFKEEYRIFDIYVSPPFRRSGLASEMANQVASIAKKNGCKILTGSVDTLANGATDGMKGFLNYGFKILRTDGSMIYLVKEI